MRFKIGAAAALLILGALALLALRGDPLEPMAMSGPRLFAEPAALLGDADGPERDIAFSSDGRLLATAAAQGPVRIRRAGRWEQIAALPHPQGAVALAFVRGTPWLATTGYDGLIRLWDLRGAQLVRSFRGSDRTLWALDASPDGRLLASAGEDRIIRLWSTDSGRLLRALPGHAENVWDVRFSPDGTMLASGSFDRRIKVWRVADGALLRTLARHDQAVVGLAWSPDSTWLASSGDDSKIRIWRAADGALRRTMRSGNHTYRLAFSRDGRWLASAGRGRTAFVTLWHGLTGLGGPADAIRLWRASDGALVATLALADDALGQPAFSPDQRWLVTGDESSTVRIWSLAAR